MSDDKSDDDETRGVDSSELDGEMSEEESAQADLQFRDLIDGSALINSSFRDINAAFNSSGTVASALAIQDAFEASGIGRIASRLSALPNADTLEIFNSEQRAIEAIQRAAMFALPKADIGHLMKAESAISLYATELRENHRLMLQQIDMLTNTRALADAFTPSSLSEAFDIPNIKNINEAFGIDRIGSALASADIASIFGFNSAFNDDLLSVTSQFSEQLAKDCLAGQAAAAAAAFEISISEKLEILLASSLAAQETLLEEYRNSSQDAKVEAAFHRRNATISTFINILIFLLTMAVAVENFWFDDDKAIKANTEAVQELQQSFDNMASQMELIQEQAKDASVEEQAADAAIVSVLREIADGLAEQSQTEGKDSSSKSPDRSDRSANTL
ncbi:hypothetical protein KUV57_11280 [Epibacterium sp. DP7N7-1]|nr:hypothetical protein [Epibacterium sp. DP7N7-1]